MKRVYLVRHGESTENLEGRYSGGSAPLTELGKRQAMYVAERFATIPFDVVLTSTMERAVHTGRLIAERSGKHIEHLDVFNELRSPSAFKGRSYRDPEIMAWHEIRNAHRHDKDWHYSDEENFYEVRERAERALTLLIERPEKNIVVATHGTFLKVCTCLIIAGAAFGPDMFHLMRINMRTRNTGITVFQYDEKDDGRGWYLSVWNDHAHLGDPKEERVEEKEEEVEREEDEGFDVASL